MRLLPLLIVAAQITGLRGDPVPKRMEEIVVMGRQDSLLGVADSATIGVTGAVQLSERPLLRPGEVLETVPGLIITQHAGGGKANQYFLRGFNLDHGTDFATFIDGVPLNMPSHGHGQGYADMNFVIPELIERVNYQKGPYYAQTGDFGTAGAAYLETFRRLPKSLLLLEGGSFGYGRALVADTVKAGSGELLYAVQGAHSDGPWEMGDNFRRANGQLTWSRGDDHDGFSTTLRFYQGEWRTSDQIPLALVETGALSPWGNMDPTNGGDSRYVSWSADWRHRHGGSEDRLQAYVFRYDLDLFSNFTYALNDPVNGDQFEQQDARTAAGFSYAHHAHGEWAGRPTEISAGLQFRHDWVDNGLYATDDRRRLSTTAQHEFGVGTVGIYAEHRVQWTPGFRSVIGGRGDLQFADVNSIATPADSGDVETAQFSPKLTLVLGPWDKTEYFFQAGYGFPSNDVRGATLASGPLRGLVPARGAEVGIRTLAVKDLQSTLSLWYLRTQQELVFIGDAGTVEPSDSSDRYGVEWANYWTPYAWLSFDLDVAASQALYSDLPTGARSVEGAIDTVVAAGVTIRNQSGWSGALRLRYFGPRDLDAAGAARSDETIMLNASVGYQLNANWQATLSVLNLLDRLDQDIAYSYESSATVGTDGIHFHPVEPIQFRLSLTGRF
ncbi:MAG: TonB-dependent receptor [Opitutales bacterium]